VRFFREPLPRYRVLAVTIALLAALWLALPVLKALAAPPDTGDIQGSATAVQDPPGSCPAQADIIPFNAVVSIKDGFLHITDPGGGASGLLNSNGTAQLTGPQETYNLLSIQGTTLNFREVYAGCTFRTTVVLQRVLYQVPTEPPSTQTNETAQPTVIGTPTVVTVPSSGGRSLSWLWVAGIATGAGVVLVGGGWWYYYYYYYSDRGGAPPEPEGFDPVPPTDGSGEEGDDRQEIG
jgi:hypothetical protein